MWLQFGIRVDAMRLFFFFFFCYLTEMLHILLFMRAHKHNLRMERVTDLDYKHASNDSLHF